MILLSTHKQYQTKKMTTRSEEENIIAAPAPKKVKVTADAVEEEDEETIDANNPAQDATKNLQVRVDNRMHDICFILTNLEPFEVYANMDKIFPGKATYMCKKLQDCCEANKGCPLLDFYMGCDSSNKKKFTAFIYEKIEQRYYNSSKK
jgi:hypothetical protein